MSVAAYCVVGVLLAGYVILDGYDLGMATLLPWLARDEHERRATLATIAPFWNGNEVWLITAGGALFALFPQAYATAFSGFYLPFVVVLWLLMGRGIAFEIREVLEHPLWHAFWDVVFQLSSALLIVLFGVALGNIVRGVPLTASSAYFLGQFGFLLNPYALGVAVLALLALTQHGATYVAFRSADATVAARARTTAGRLFPAVAACYVLLSAGTFAVRSPATFGPAPAMAVGAAIALAGLAGVRAFLARPGRGAFLASATFLAGLLVSAAATTYPYLLPGYPDVRTGIDVVRAAPNAAALATALSATFVGLVLLAVYRTTLARRLTADAPHD